MSPSAQVVSTPKVSSVFHTDAAAAQALLDVEGLSAEQIARKAMNIAADLCVYTNHEHMVEVLDSVVKDKTK